ncbi:MAG: type II toxin-antitoxin system Phd/YefM family antitoxin [Candidatus Sumerlaeia bacterium]
MKTVNLTRFRQEVSGYLSAVEKGEVLVVSRHGKPIAEITPVDNLAKTPAWKQPPLRLSTKGKGLTDAVLGERCDEDLL